MKRILWYWVVVPIVALMAGACASTPPPKEEAPPPAPPAPTVVTVPAPEEELKNAESLKETIDKYNLSFALPDEYQRANEELAAGKEAMGKDNARAKDLLVSAGKRYNAVLDAGLEKTAETRSTEMNTARKKAEAAKAPRAAVSEYTLAENKRAEAMRLYGEKKYLEAYQASEEAVAAYNRSIEIAEQKRLAAEKKLSDAAQEQEVTTSRLEEVSKEISGGNP
ncbi:MAG: hypothetical protein KA771_05995 [Spirochaetales bacterium]|nr:hypothetical protein [Spirochaetales bacterium]